MEDIEQKFKEEVFIYLDALRESGETNMYGAPAYVESEFDVDIELAKTLVSEWMKTFSQRHSKPTPSPTVERK